MYAPGWLIMDGDFDFALHLDHSPLVGLLNP